MSQDKKKIKNLTRS